MDEALRAVARHGLGEVLRGENVTSVDGSNEREVLGWSGSKKLGRGSVGVVIRGWHGVWAVGIGGVFCVFGL